MNAVTSFIVRRLGPKSGERHVYGPFSDEVLAELVAVRAIEKHVGATVSVEPTNLAGGRARA